MGLTSTGDIVGSVSGGCVEGSVAEVGQGILRGDRPQLLHFGVSDETAWSVGLACGGEIDVYVARLASDQLEFIRSALETNLPVATLTIIRGPQNLVGRQMRARGNQAEERLGTIGHGLDKAAVERISEGIRTNRSFRVEFAADDLEDAVEAFVDVIPSPPKMVIVGGVHITVALASMAAQVGHETIVIDPRRTFGSQNRFPDVDRLIQAWPQEAMADLDLNTSTAVIVLTHDPKIDDPALIAALSSPAYYIGALGSRRTHEKRIRRLIESGVYEESLARLHAPIGLDLGAQSPEEIAVAIMAEVIQAYRLAN
jgi:xanthine dehydrogenase accessory factor